MDGRLISVAEAAERLGVNPQRVRALIAADRLPARRIGREYALDTESVAAFGRRQRLRGRPWSARNAWALLAALSGRDDAVRTSPSSASRIRAFVQQGGDAVVQALAGSQPRSRVHRWRVLPADLDRLAADSRLVPTALSADHPQIDVRYDRERDGLDAYTSAQVVAALEAKLEPVRDVSRPNLVLRVPLESDWILSEPVASTAVAAADVLLHRDPRLQRAGERALRRVARAD